jgi:hypothetical protein
LLLLLLLVVLLLGSGGATRSRAGGQKKWGWAGRPQQFVTCKYGVWPSVENKSGCGLKVMIMALLMGSRSKGERGYPLWHLPNPTQRSQPSCVVSSMPPLWNKDALVVVYPPCCMLLLSDFLDMISRLLKPNFEGVAAADHCTCLSSDNSWQMVLTLTDCVKSGVVT